MTRIRFRRTKKNDLNTITLNSGEPFVDLNEKEIYVGTEENQNLNKSIPLLTAKRVKIDNISYTLHIENGVLKLKKATK